MLQIKLKYTRQRIEDPNLHIAWGDIVGDVSGNTALQDALDNKQNVGDYATHNDLSTVEDSLQNAINQAKDDINGELDKKQDKGNYALQGDSYTKTESDERYMKVGDVPTDVYTKEQVDNKLSNKADKSEIPTIPLFRTINGQSITGDTTNIVIEGGGSGADMSNYYTKSESDNKYALKGDIPTNIYTKTEVDNKLSEKLDITAYTKYDDTTIKADIAKKADKTYVDSELSNKQDKGDYVSATTLNDYALKSEIPSVEGLASQTYVSNKIKEVVGTAPEALDTLGEIADKLSGDDDAIAAINQVLDGKVSKEDYNTNQQAITNSLTDLSNNKADKSEIPTIPLFRTINGQAITGDTTNIIIDTDLTDYYTKTQVDTKLSKKLDISAYTPYDDTQVKADIQANTTAIEGKQDKGNYALSGDSYTKAESDAKYLTEHQSLTDYAKTADVNTELAKKQDKGDYVSATTLNDYAKKTDIPNTSEFITSAYTYTKTEIDTSLGNKADKNHGHDIDDISYQLDSLNLYNYSGENVQYGWNYYGSIFYFATSPLDDDIFDKNASITLYFDENKTEYIKLEPQEEVGALIWKATDYNYQYFDSSWYYQSEYVSQECSSSEIRFTNKQGKIYYCKVENYEGEIGYISRTTRFLDNLLSNKADKGELYNKYYNKTEIDNMVGDINNALNGLSFWKGTQEEYDAITTKDGNTIYYII